MADDVRWYPSKIDWWIGALLALIPVACAAAVVAAIRAGDGIVVALLGAAGVVVLFVALVFPMRYAVTDEAVIVRHGWLRQRVRLADILEVRPTRNPLSSPALSLDRIELRFGEGLFKRILISPADKAGFLADLARRARLRQDGERLVRGPD